jgi:hypothetical protein
MAMVVACSVAVGLPACGRMLAVGDVSTVDGSIDDATVVDAGAGPDADTVQCTTSAPFVRFDRIAGLDTDEDKELPRLSRNERAIYFFKSDFDAGSQLFGATRPDRTAPFEMVTRLFAGTTNALGAAPSGDDLRLYLVGGPGYSQLLMAERTSEAETFPSPKVLVDGGSGDVSYDSPVLIEPPGRKPRLLVAGSTAGVGPHLWSADVDEAGAPLTFTPVDGTNDPSSTEEAPTPSADGLTLYFYSDRESAGHGRVFVAHRSTTDAPFTTVAPVDEIVRPPQGYVSPGYLSVDNCRLYYNEAKGPLEHSALFVATRSPSSSDERKSDALKRERPPRETEQDRARFRPIYIGG